MAHKSNVFTASHQAFLEKLADLGHFQLLVGWQFGLTRESFKRSLSVAEKHGLKDYYGAANCMSIMNIFHDGKLNIQAPYGKRETQGDRLLPMAEEMQRRFNSFLLVWIFESLENHLQAIHGLLLYQLRHELRILDKKQFHRSNPSLAKQEGTPQYFAGYARYAWKHDYKNVLALFEKCVAWHRVKCPAYHDIPWRILIETIAFCRHRISELM